MKTALTLTDMRVMLGRSVGRALIIHRPSQMTIDVFVEQDYYDFTVDFCRHYLALTVGYKVGLLSEDQIMALCGVVTVTV